MSAYVQQKPVLVNLLQSNPLDPEPSKQLHRPQNEEARALLKRQIDDPLSLDDKDQKKIKLTPVVLDDETRALYKRAIAKPSSLSDNDRRKIQGRMSREKEDSSCHKECGLTMSELIAKAIHNPDLISYTEAELITVGVPYENDDDRQYIKLFARLNKDDRELHEEAFTASVTADEAIAQERCSAKLCGWDSDIVAASQFLDMNDKGNIEKALRGPRQDHVISMSNLPHKIAPYGFVVFYAKGVDWTVFKEKIHKFAHYGFVIRAQLVKEAIEEGFTLHGVEHDSLDTSQQRLVNLRDAGEIPKGLRQDAFLYVDHESVKSEEDNRPFVWLWEPEATKYGPLKVDIRHVAPVLIARLMQRNLPSTKDRLGPYKHAPDFSLLHEDSKLSRWVPKENVLDRGVMDGIWPPGPGAM